MFKLDLEKAEEQRSNCQHPLDHRKRRELKKKFSCFIDYAKTFDCGSQQTVENLKDMSKLNVCLSHFNL